MFFSALPCICWAVFKCNDLKRREINQMRAFYQADAFQARTCKKLDVFFENALLYGNDDYLSRSRKSAILMGIEN